MKNKFADQAPFAPKEKTARPITKRWWFYVLIAVVVIAAINAITGGKKNDKINWDNVELHQRLPVPPSNKGSLYTNTAEELSVHIDKVSDDRYTAYLSECIAKGFTVDADKGTSDYSAYDAEGYFLSLSHIGERLSIHEKMILSETKAALFLKQLQEFKEQLDMKVSNYLAEDIEGFMSGFADMQQGMLTGDSDLVIRGNVTIQKVLGREPQFTNQKEFDALMESDAPLVL